MRKLVCQSGREAGREFALPDGQLRVGRHPENDLQISEPSVSSFHCLLHVAEIGVGVQDLNSTNGTFINQKQVTKGLLHSGDTLTLGEISFRVQLPEITVALPEIPKVEPQGAAFLDDGAPACFNHREVQALFRCTKCENWWCGECVRAMKRISGAFLHFCPDCSAACVPIIFERAAVKKGLFSRVADTLFIRKK